MKASFKFLIGAAMSAVVLFGCSDDNGNGGGPTGGDGTYWLRITTSPIEGGSVLREPHQTSYVDGMVITLTAEPNDGFEFAGYSGDLSSTSNPFRFNISGNTTLVANFRAIGDDSCISGVDCPDDVGYCGSECTPTTRANCSGTLNANRPASCDNDNPPPPPTGDTFVDSRDNKTYRMVTIGNQTWMAENLNYATTSGSWCYNDETSNCNTYGRLYDWATAMGFESSCNTSSCASQIQTNHRGICPTGWRVPTHDDWSELETAVGGSSTAARHLKAETGWEDCGPAGSGNSYRAMILTGFRLCPAAAAGMVLPAMSATGATGGRLRRAARRTRGSGTCTTTSRMCSGTSTIGVTGSRCVV